MDILLQCRGRWRNIVLDVTPKLIPSNLSSLFQLQADDSPPRLESHTLSMSFLTLLGSRVGLFEKVPHLKSMILFGASALKNREGRLATTFIPKVLPSDGYTPAEAAGGLIVGSTRVAPLQFRSTIPPATFFPLPRDISRKLLLPWKQLSKLDLEFAAFGDFLPVLNQAPNLVGCCLRSDAYTENAHGYIVISLSKLILNLTHCRRYDAVT
ncbi:hypothetical protein L218DRAFT_618784 [Marasmius fiardii PR-910]|nr:hypothetical protein L218DRAFT_618784 [Marasmius fiardii PR-910]